MTEQESVSITSDVDTVSLYEMMTDIEADLSEIHGDLDVIIADNVDIQTYYTSQIVSSALLGLIAGILFVLVFKHK